MKFLNHTPQLQMLWWDITSDKGNKKCIQDIRWCKPFGKQLFGTQRKWWENIKVDIQELVCKDENLNELDQV